MDNVHDSSHSGRMVSHTRINGIVNLQGGVTLEQFFIELAKYGVAITPEARDALLFARNSGAMHAPAHGEIRFVIGEMSRAGFVWESLGALVVEHGKLVTYFTEAEIINISVKAVRRKNIHTLQGTFIFLSNQTLGKNGFEAMYGFGATELGVTFGLYPRDKKLGLPLHVAFTVAPNVIRFRPKKMV